jgi:ethanolamine transporter EutH
MQTLTHLAALSADPGILAAVDATSGTRIITTLRNFVYPFVLIFFVVFSLKYLMSRKMTQFFQFVGIGVLVSIIFWAPDIIRSLSDVVTGIVKS